jgi:hypothetical protein
MVLPNTEKSVFDVEKLAIAYIFAWLKNRVNVPVSDKVLGMPSAVPNSVPKRKPDNKRAGKALPGFFIL